jgi:hypothetical protein
MNDLKDENSISSDLNLIEHQNDIVTLPKYNSRGNQANSPNCVKANLPDLALVPFHLKNPMQTNCG